MEETPGHKTTCSNVKFRSADTDNQSGCRIKYHITLREHITIHRKSLDHFVKCCGKFRIGWVEFLTLSPFRSARSLMIPSEDERAAA